MNRLADRSTALENQLLNYVSRYSPTTPPEALQRRYDACQQCGQLAGAGCRAFGCTDQSGPRRRFFAAICDLTTPCPYKPEAWKP